jgi:hypothetical protein
MSPASVGRNPHPKVDQDAVAVAVGRALDEQAVGPLDQGPARLPPAGSSTAFAR